ncbi:MAG: hypothetical protein ACI4HI_12450, partial [Lachnospiraceae bacterium]
GSLAGYVYGRGGNTGIPEEWLRQLSRYEWLEERVEAFGKLVGAVTHVLVNDPTKVSGGCCSAG